MQTHTKSTNRRARHPPQSTGIPEKSKLKHPPPLPTCPHPTPHTQHVGRGQAIHFERNIPTRPPKTYESIKDYSINRTYMVAGKHTYALQLVIEFDASNK